MKEGVIGRNVCGGEVTELELQIGMQVPETELVVSGSLCSKSPKVYTY